MKKLDIVSKVRSFNDDESGMEAAQVILILFLVVVGLIPIILTLKNKLAAKGTTINNQVDLVK